jgi:hypothetical protein
MFMIEETDRNAQCYVKAIRKGEPVFVLRAQDVTAAVTVRYWLDANPQLSAERRHEVQEIIRAMLAWKETKRAD